MHQQSELFETKKPLESFDLTVTLNYAEGCVVMEWNRHHPSLGVEVRVRSSASNELTWEHLRSGDKEPLRHTSSAHRTSIRSVLRKLKMSYCFGAGTFRAGMIRASPNPTVRSWEAISTGIVSPWAWIEDRIAEMAHQMRLQFKQGGRTAAENDERLLRHYEKEALRQQRLNQEAARRRAKQAAQARQRTKRDASPPLAPAAQTPKTLPVPPVPWTVAAADLPRLDSAALAGDLRSYFLAERAALWWVSNQSDDLLCLPYCRIERFEYQIRSALRVIGALRGRALLSDEVGLGKTIEAGLVLKEYLTRGMIKRFLVLTVPSLVDQWQEELEEKFGLVTASTNQARFRADPAAFWREERAIVASLHTLKQANHLDIAKTANWDLLIVDEAHYLRNRTSLSWQAVDALPRQFLLLLTATPVQNSLEELYNLVTLLQPGQLPSPKEFRARFVDPARPHQPREPEELRRLLGQVMIRNTRANAGINLPPRRAETVMFEIEPSEQSFREQWERELRECLARLTASQASLWGRLLLQAMGSSPAAWLDALKSFPDAGAAEKWRSEGGALEASWKKKCNSLIPLTKVAGGVVIFSQFLWTQAELAQHLKHAGVPVWVIHGQTPAVERQPITEEFRERGSGALLLTHSGTEGRNLQFCHQLVNFDLPWNPMEIEQRIGRLHRIGQKQPVRIYNLIHAGTLQEHLLNILQEKLNLFELVVGETGLILGDRFSSDEFAEEVLRRWRESEGRVAESMQSLGQELADARAGYDQVKQLDETLFANTYESL